MLQFSTTGQPNPDPFAWVPLHLVTIQFLKSEGFSASALQANSIVTGEMAESMYFLVSFREYVQHF